MLQNLKREILVADAARHPAHHLPSHAVAEVAAAVSVVAVDLTEVLAARRL